MLLGVGGELQAKIQLDDSLFSTSAKKGRQTGHENGYICDEESNHRSILNESVR